MSKINWQKYAPYITPSEVMCKCGACGIESADNMSPEHLDIMLDIRLEVGFPIHYSSVYRCENHPEEIGKAEPGTHQKGLADDKRCSNNEAFEINKALANHPKIKSIRFHQKGVHGDRFIHSDSFDRGFNHIGSY